MRERAMAIAILIASPLLAFAQAEAPEIADLAKALSAPLPSPPHLPGNLIALPAGYPPNRALALNRLNQYRLAAGLRPYAYDPALSSMGQAHADYLLANPGAGGEHSERPGAEGYSKAGDEAARTSGIAYGEADPLEALEGLMGGTYHRLQFLRREETRVGLGWSYGPPAPGSYASGGTLFVTRGEEGAARPADPHFVPFPPDGFADSPCAFAKGEFPDPRPGRGPGSPDTGYPITIGLRHEDALKFEGASARLLDAKGTELPFWLSYPGKPAVASPDLSIYAGDKASILEFYRNNFDAVFILPKEPLEKGETYAVKVELRIGGKAETLAWSFTTRGATLWNAAPKPADPRERLEAALSRARDGDTVLLEPGEYDFDQPIVLDRAIRVRAAPGKVSLRYRGTGNFTAFGIHGRVVLSGLAFQGKVDFYLPSGCGLLLEGCRFVGDDPQAVLAVVERGASLVVAGCDFSSLASPYLAYFGDAPAEAAPPLLYLGVGNAFGPRSHQGKRSFGPGVERELRRPLR